MRVGGCKCHSDHIKAHVKVPRCWGHGRGRPLHRPGQVGGGRSKGLCGVACWCYPTHYPQMDWTCGLLLPFPHLSDPHMHTPHTCMAPFLLVRFSCPSFPPHLHIPSSPRPPFTPAGLTPSTLCLAWCASRCACPGTVVNCHKALHVIAADALATLHQSRCKRAPNSLAPPCSCAGALGVRGNGYLQQLGVGSVGAGRERSASLHVSAGLLSRRPRAMFTGCGSADGVGGCTRSAKFESFLPHTTRVLNLPPRGGACRGP